ncbi:MAG: tRNA pseudouridine(55) synthase TruB [Planctomycetota bacterium]
MNDRTTPDQSDRPAPSGVMVIDKPLHRTSMAVCARIRGKLKAGGASKRIKVGHGGTLDPLATGVLVVLIGKATKRCNEIMAGEKGYAATIDLSRTSPTDDLEAETTVFPVEHVPDRAHIERALAEHFVGTIQQRPPAYSAMKVNGKRAYELARAGKLDTLDPRPVRIDEIIIVDYDFPNLSIDIRCGKGTYIRSLARDIDKALHTGGVLTALRRTRVGAHTIDNAIALDDLPETLNPWDLPGAS